MSTTLYQVVVVRPNATGFGGSWTERPYPPAAGYMAAREQYAQAWLQRPDALQVIVLAGDDNAELYNGYNNLVNGLPYTYAEMTEEALHRWVEFQPLRPDEDYLVYEKPKPLSRFSMPKAEWAALIRVMGKVHRGEIGGAEDGIEKYPSVPFFDAPDPAPEPESPESFVEDVSDDAPPPPEEE